MQTKSIILSLTLLLQINVLFAGSFDTKSMTASESGAYGMNILAPVTPSEATFEEAITAEPALTDFSFVAPVTPAEASFEEAGTPDVPMSNIEALTPVTPAEAVFEAI